MLEQGEVIKVTPQSTIVKTRRRMACHHCQQRGYCRPLTDQKDVVLLEALNPLGAKVGDIVWVEVSSFSVIVLTLLIFGLPLLGLFGAISLVRFWGLSWPQEWVAIGGMGIGFFILWIINKLVKDRVREKPRIVRIENKN